MPWTSELVSFELKGFMVHAVVKFTNSDTNEEIIDSGIFGNDLNADRLAAQVERRVIVLEERDAAAATLVAGPIVLPRDKVLTPEEQAALDARIAADLFFAKLANLNALKVQVEKGIIKPDDAAIAAAADEVKSLFLPEYAKDSRFQ